jgi:hypothetical protein
MKKELIWGSYLGLIILLFILGYVLSKNHKFEYALLGTLIGVLTSLLLWVTWGYKIADD